MRAISTRSYTDQANQAEIPSWEDMELKPVLARQMEACAAFLDFADHHTGRLIDALAQLDVAPTVLEVAN
jgi:arylsulfatase A-like enzyme